MHCDCSSKEVLPFAEQIHHFATLLCDAVCCMQGKNAYDFNFRTTQKLKTLYFFLANRNIVSSAYLCARQGKLPDMCRIHVILSKLQPLLKLRGVARMWALRMPIYILLLEEKN